MVFSVIDDQSSVDVITKKFDSEPSFVKETKLSILADSSPNVSSFTQSTQSTTRLSLVSEDTPKTHFASPITFADTKGID